MITKLSKKELHEPLMTTIGRIRQRILITGDARLLNLFEHAVKQVEAMEIQTANLQTFQDEVKIYAELAKRYEKIIRSMNKIPNDADPSFNLYIGEEVNHD
jgi:hypothetical protein